MSHITNFKNDCLVNTDRARLNAALREMGITLDTENRKIENAWINDTVDAVLVVDGKRIPAGLNFKMVDGNETIEVSGDFYGTGINQKELTDKLAQVYQKHDIVAKCKDQKWYVDEAAENIREDENGDYVIQAYRYV
jgi:hypothetical protein